MLRRGILIDSNNILFYGELMVIMQNKSYYLVCHKSFMGSKMSPKYEVLRLWKAYTYNLWV